MYSLTSSVNEQNEQQKTQAKFKAQENTLVPRVNIRLAQYVRKIDYIYDIKSRKKYTKALGMTLIHLQVLLQKYIMTLAFFDIS